MGDQSPSGWFGQLKGRSLGVYLGDVTRAPEALVLVRYELDASAWKRALFGKHVMIVDEVLLNPAVPERLRTPLRAGIVSALLSLGFFHEMPVLFWEDFDV